MKKVKIIISCTECGNKSPCVDPPIFFNRQTQEFVCNRTGIVLTEEQLKKPRIKTSKKKKEK